MLSPTTTKHLLNCLLILGFGFYFGFPILAMYLHFPSQDMELRNSAYSLTLLVQLVRGVLWHLDFRTKPPWLLFSKMDKRLLADSSALYILIFVILELTVRRQMHQDWEAVARPISYFLFGLEVILGIWLLMLSSKKTNTGIGVVIFAATIFWLPLAIAAALGFAIWKFLNLGGGRDYEILAVSCFVPMMVAIASLAANDKRDRGKNTLTVIGSQLMTLPAIPLCFLLMRAYWPIHWSPFIPLLLVMVLITIPILFRARSKPWLIKEKVEELSRKAPQASYVETQSEIEQILKQLAAKELTLRNANDHIDRADAFWKLGDLQRERMCNIDAESNYREAIAAYNEALKLEPNNQVAIAHKFKTVECLSQVQRLQASSEN